MLKRYDHLLMNQPKTLNTADALEMLIDRMNPADTISAGELAAEVKQIMLDDMRYVAHMHPIPLDADTTLSLLDFQLIVQALLLKLHHESITTDDNSRRTFSEWWERACFGHKNSIQDEQ